MKTREKKKFEMPTGSVSKIVLFTVLIQDKAEKKFFKKLLNENLAVFCQFLEVFSVWDDQIDFLSLESLQAC